jgi:hypothetical protein
MVKRKRTALIQIRVTPAEEHDAEKTSERLDYPSLAKM